MADFPGNHSAVDDFAFRAAVEAVVGLTLQGARPDRESVQAWLETATVADVPTRAFRGRALYFAERMIGGPFRPDGSAA